MAGELGGEIPIESLDDFKKQVMNYWNPVKTDKELVEKCRQSPLEMQEIIYSVPAREPGEDYSRLMEAVEKAVLSKAIPLIRQAERDRIKQELEDFERVSNVENYTRIMIPTEVLNKIFSEH